MDTTSISKVYKKYIPLLLELIMESPVKRDDQLIPYEEIIDELKADTALATTRISVQKPIAFSYKSSSVYLMLQVCIHYMCNIQFIIISSFIRVIKAI